MEKKKIIIIICSIIALILLLGVSSYFIFFRKSSSDIPKLEINENSNIDDSQEDNRENNNEENTIEDNSSDNNRNGKVNDDSNYTEEDVVNYFDSNYNEVNNSTWDKVKDKSKEYFITIVDFIFYEKEIKGHTFNDLSSTAKLKVISIALKLDSKIEEKIPNYKETISNTSNRVYTNAKEKLVTLYFDISSSLCSKYEDGCDTAKEIFSDIKDNCKIGWGFVKDLLSEGGSKLKDWYEVYSGK